MYSTSTLRNIAILLVAFLFASVSCTRITNTQIGSGLIPAADGVYTFDTTMEVITDSFDETDTTRIYKQDLHTLGTISNDPLFGKTSAALNFELFPDYFPYAVPGTKDSIRADSAVLILSYNSFYGDSTQPLRISVDEISRITPLDPYKVYPSNFPAIYPIGSAGSLGNTATIDIRRIGDSVINRYELSKNQIRIKLRNDVARRFLNIYDSTNAYRSDTLFRTYFAGFTMKVESTSPANALLFINMLDTNTKLALYYNSNTTGATTRDTNAIYFRFNPFTSGDANYITRNRAGSEVAGRLTTTSKPDSMVYVQASPGTYVRIKIPNLNKLNNRIIHRAELITEQIPDNANLMTTDLYMAPPRLLLLSIYDSANKIKRNIPSDYQIGQSGPNTASFGGYLNYKTVTGYDRLAGYTFELTRYLQGIVTRKDTSFTMRLTAPTNDSIRYTPAYPNNFISQVYYLNPNIGNIVGNGRIRLGGGSHTRFRMRLRIVYSKI